MHSIIRTSYDFGNLFVEVESNLLTVIQYINSYCCYVQNRSSSSSCYHFRIQHMNNKEICTKRNKALEKEGLFQSVIHTHKNGMYIERYRYNAVEMFRIKDTCNIIIKEGSNIEIITDSNDEVCGSLVLRVIRELLFRVEENLYGVTMHAAACYHPTAGGILICGEKGTGKTTMLFDLLKCGCSFIANDRVIVSSCDSGVFVKAVPLCIRAGMGTIKQPYLGIDMNRLSLARSSNYQKTVLDEMIHPTINSKVKIEFTPHEISRIFNSENLFSCELNYVLLPKFSINNKVICEKIMSPNGGVAIKQACCTPNDPNWLAPWLLQRVHTNLDLIKNADRCISDILSRCKVIEVEFGNTLAAWSKETLKMSST